MTSEQAALIKKAEESLRAARLLAKDTLYNFAASRAYYAMFYVAQAFLLDEKLAYSKFISAYSGGLFPDSSRARGMCACGWQV